MLSLATVALVGCQKEQSSFNIEDISGKAKIMGTLAYDAGQGYADNTYTRLIKAAAGVRVVAKVDNTTILNTSEGYTVYETTTDEQGNYTIEVPAHNNNPVSVEIIADPFFATYSEVVGVENNQPQIEEKQKLFKLEGTTCSVTPNDIEIYDKMFSPEGRDNEFDTYKYNSTFYIKVGEGRYRKYSIENQVLVAQEYKALSNQEVLVRIDGECYAAMTNNNGEAQFIIPAQAEQWETEIEIEVPSYVTNKFEFFERTWDDNGETVYTTHILQGTFDQFDSQAYLEFSGIEGVPAPVRKVRMIFNPFEGEETHGYNAGDWYYTPWDDEAED